MPVAAVKTGMFPDAEAVSAVVARAQGRRAAEPGGRPGAAHRGLKSRKQVASALERLLPYALVATPNRDEASALLGWQVATPADMALAARQLVAGGPQYVVVTGGDLVTGTEALDAVWAAGKERFMSAPRISGRNTLGSGAVFSAAIAARLAHGDDGASTRWRTRRAWSRGRSRTRPTGGIGSRPRPDRRVRLVVAGALIRDLGNRGRWPIADSTIAVSPGQAVAALDHRLHVRRAAERGPQPGDRHLHRVLVGAARQHPQQRRPGQHLAARLGERPQHRHRARRQRLEQAVRPRRRARAGSTVVPATSQRRARRGSSSTSARTSAPSRGRAGATTGTPRATSGAAVELRRRRRP